MKVPRMMLSSQALQSYIFHLSPSTSYKCFSAGNINSHISCPCSLRLEHHKAERCYNIMWGYFIKWFRNSRRRLVSGDDANAPCCQLTEWWHHLLWLCKSTVLAPARADEARWVVETCCLCLILLSRSRDVACFHLPIYLLYKYCPTASNAIIGHCPSLWRLMLQVLKYRWQTSLKLTIIIWQRRMLMIIVV